MSDIVHLTDLTVENGNNTILEGINLEISSGETVALLGASDCGKSTLLDVIHGHVCRFFNFNDHWFFANIFNFSN